MSDNVIVHTNGAYELRKLGIYLQINGFKDTMNIVENIIRTNKLYTRAIKPSLRLDLSTKEMLGWDRLIHYKDSWYTGYDIMSIDEFMGDAMYTYTDLINDIAIEIKELV